MSTQKNEHNPDNLSRKQVGKGWRILGPNERQQHGDEWWNDVTNQWEANHEKDIGRRVYGDGTWYITYRRRIAPPTDTTVSGREGETPETDEFEPKHQISVHHWADFARKLERQRDAALAQVEALRRAAKEFEKQVARRLWTSDDGVNIRASDPGDYIDDDPALATAWSLFRAAIDSAQRQEGR